jgi:fermentation-respiration switch protein FrsA (DUF1100 family)
MKLGLVLGLALGLAFVPACASLDSFLYDGKRVDAYTFTYPPGTPAAWQVPAAAREELVLDRDDGTKVYAVFVRRPAPEDRSAPTVLYHHGNKWGIDEYWVRISRLWALGANVLAYEYPGYGRASGTPTEAGIYANARTALAWLRALGPAIDQQRLFHYGYSLGGGPAVETALRGGPYRGLVTESTFASVGALVSDGSLVVPRSFVTENQFDNAAKIQAAARAADPSVGVLIFHGDADDFVQPKYATTLDDAIGGAAPHRKILVPGADHGGVPDGAAWEPELTAFLAK